MYWWFCFWLMVCLKASVPNKKRENYHTGTLTLGNMIRGGWVQGDEWPPLRRWQPAINITRRHQNSSQKSMHPSTASRALVRTSETLTVSRSTGAIISFNRFAAGSCSRWENKKSGGPSKVMARPWRLINPGGTRRFFFSFWRLSKKCKKEKNLLYYMSENKWGCCGSRWCSIISSPNFTQLSGCNGLINTPGVETTAPERQTCHQICNDCIFF